MSKVINEVKVSLNEFIDLINSKRNTFISICSITEQRIFNKGRGKNSMINLIGIDPDKIMCRSVRTVSIGSSLGYENMVNNRLDKSGSPANFTSEPLSYGKWLSRSEGLIITNSEELNKETLFLRTYDLHNNNNNCSKEYFYEGKLIDINDSKFDSFRKERKYYSSSQGLDDDKKIIVMNFKFSNIEFIKVDSTIYKLSLP